MKVIEPGHIYLLENRHQGRQRLVFLKNLPDCEEGHDGVLNQEVLRAVLDRMFELNRQEPCHENIDIIVKLREILILMEQRAARRTMEKAYRLTGENIEDQPPLANGHVFDLGGSAFFEQLAMQIKEVSTGKKEDKKSKKKKRRS